MQSIILQKITRFSVIVALIAFFSSNISAQTDVKIGNNPGNKTASAVLELESTTKGFLLPRMTAAQMSAIATPANGLAVYNTDQQCTFIYKGSSWVSLCDSATNGLTKTGSTISLGGALTGATTVTTSATNTLAIAGLQGGAATDSIMTLDAATGILKRRTVSDVLAGAGNVWLLGGNTLAANQTIGSNNAFDFTIETNNISRLTFSSAGAITQEAGGGQVTFTGNVDATNGLDVTTGLLTANAGSTLTGATNINATGAGATNIGNATSATTVLGATTINTTGTAATSIGNSASTVTVAGTTSVTGATTINTTGALGTTIGNAASATSITGATSINTTGALGTSIGNAASTTSVIGTTNINTSGASTTTIGNSGAAAVIAGSTVGVTGATNINTTGSAATVIGNATSTTTITGPNVNITGLVGGASTDSLVTVNGTGTLRKRTVADVVGGAITADNGLTKNTANNVQLGGTLLQATSIAQAGFDFKLSGGNVAIGSSTAPNSTLQITGSQAASYRKVTGATTLNATDYIVLANATAGAITLTLPAASTCSGRMYYIGKSDESTNAVTFSPALSLTETTTISSINFAKKYKIVSDGTNWIIYNE